MVRVWFFLVVALAALRFVYADEVVLPTADDFSISRVLERLARRADSPWSHGTLREEPITTNDPAYLRAVQALKANSDTRWSPWVMIDGDDEEAAAVAALSAIADAWAEAMPASPPHLVSTSMRA